MSDEFSRTRLMLGDAAMRRLKDCRVAVFGLGGVGGYTAEALARSGVGALDLIDNDTVDISNINRQIIALHSTVGMKKTEAAKNRLLDINPDIKIRTFDVFFSEQTANMFDFTDYDYVVDAIDSVSGKIQLAVQAQACGVPAISSMGAGNKLDPTRFEVDDIYKTSVCPLAKVMRRELKKRGIKKLKVVYSREEPVKLPENACPAEGKKRVPASIAFVPSTVGLIIAGEVIKDLISYKGENK